MGEMTLENTKPRRGRKPKKADICHLIYKNYGTIVPGREFLSETVTASSKESLHETLIKKKQIIEEKTKRKAKKLKIVGYHN